MEAAYFDAETAHELTGVEDVAGAWGWAEAEAEAEAEQAEPLHLVERKHRKSCYQRSVQVDAK